ncbi:hypothetical protein EOD42_08615 [Rhodovarius crocodyli]|uniref:Transmembrane protein n=1 Tax=Rhodovarius crocodyli TaxID=1979269 RepID=A0A437MJR5_9PROT|nr:hypothetical protein [Rhodovarius crocodyli]RVT97846.1 hypothetical protein EOD42_08615 [Rhodovarius crocodyli]
MHMTLVIAAGLLLLAVFLLFGWLWGASAEGIALAARCFLPAWAVLAVANMWVGVTRAGYTMGQELPILTVVFLLPAAVAGLVMWRLPTP